jgi:hypothetical protein
MATPYAGSHHGMHLPLLAGTEVLVAFRDGDPDQPVITAAVPNSENPSLTRQSNPYAHQWRTAGGNGMYLDDRNGRQGLFMHSPSASSTIALGSINTDGGKTEGIAITTQGDMNTIVAGTRTFAQVGGTDMVTVGYMGDMNAAFGSSLEFGPTLNWSAGPALEVFGGPEQAYTSQAWQQLAPSAQLGADADLVLRGGLNDEARTALRALRKRCGTTAFVGAAGATAFASAAHYAIPDSTAGWRWGAAGLAAGGCFAATVAARGALGKFVERSTNAMKDAHASELLLQRGQLQMEHRPGWASRVRRLRMDDQGMALEASANRDSPADTRAWSQDPDKSRAVAAEASLDIDGVAPSLRASIGQATKLALHATRLELGYDDECMWRANAQGDITVDAKEIAILEQDLLDIG